MSTIFPHSEATAAAILCPLQRVSLVEKDRIDNALARQRFENIVFRGFKHVVRQFLYCTSSIIPNLVQAIFKPFGNPRCAKSSTTMVLAVTWRRLFHILPNLEEH
eukprot:m.237239 g.237239  ORF g.237239 m.237239 type:complete len:105 (-) comp16055_c1_seq1:285-599(-)